MKMKSTALFLALSAGAFGQQYETTRARITGGGGDQGKCSFEVQVDGTVEIEVLGDQARMRSLAGANGQWRKMDCNMVMPPNPAQFAFNPQSGRGKQTLSMPPNDNRGIAVVKVEDSQGGSDVYKFEMTWKGTTGPQNRSNGPGRNATGGSIFDSPSNTTNNFPSNNSNFPTNGGFPNTQTQATTTWNDQVNYKGSGGSGYLRLFRGSDDTINDGQVDIDRSGRVQVSLNTRSNGRVQMNGNLILVQGDRLVANLSGGTMQGTMEILLDSRNRVQELAMTGVGRSRFELRWQPQ